MVKKPHSLFLLLALVFLLSGCGKEKAAPETIPETTEPVILATVPAPGNPDDVTCKGSYSADGFSPDTEVAILGESSLTNEQLQVWYALAVSSYRQANHDIAPDFSEDLATQVCPIDDTVGSWQQYFLGQALNAWHIAQALAQQAADVPFPTEKAYKPDPEEHQQIVDLPATKWLYGYHPYYEPNSMHQAYLDAMPETLDALAKDLGLSGFAQMAKAMEVSESTFADVVKLYNFAYMYFTQLSYDLSVTESEIVAYLQEHPEFCDNSEKTVDFRHILMIPEGEEELAWQQCYWKADALLKSWKNRHKSSEYSFADLAAERSLDSATVTDGGAYRQIRRGQLPPEVEEWCFDDARQPGDTTFVRTDMGFHLLYFSGCSDSGFTAAENLLLGESQTRLIRDVQEAYPAQVNYNAITLTRETQAPSFDAVLYPDLAHERYPEVPLYLQQDYGNTMYGYYPLSSHGCGISCLAMAASYMTDQEVTPAQLCARYGSYCYESGTDSMIYYYEAPVLGFYLQEVTHQPDDAIKALEQGHIVINLQSKGYWTRGGHYILLEKLNEDGTVQVRDSHLANYGRIEDHARDRHTWQSITGATAGFWIFREKVTTLPACSRCGDPDSCTGRLSTGDYHCRKCEPALIRRDSFLSVFPE